MITLLIPIVAAGIVSVLIGFFWYHPRIFGAAWMRMANLTPEIVEATRKSARARTFAALVASMVMASVLSYIEAALGVHDALGAVVIGAWLWLGFIAPTLLDQVLWERRPTSPYFINSIYWLVSMLAMALIVTYR